MNTHLIPFFVADRPASLRILKGVLLKHPRRKVGIMTHAFTSENFWHLFSDFPYHTPLLYGSQTLLAHEEDLASSVIKMTDSGIFGKKGCTIEYEELYGRYNALGTDYGIMIDVLRDSRATLKSAEKAIRVFEKNNKRRFKLVAVAQGNNLDEYLQCYEKLSRHFEYVAVGGLLKKRENTARYVSVRDETLMYEVLRSIRQEFNPRWLFALGSYHPTRHTEFERIGIWGSDYKGWIFNYQLKRDLVSETMRSFLNVKPTNGLNKTLGPVWIRTTHMESKLKRQERKWREERDGKQKSKLRKKVKEVKRELTSLHEQLLLKAVRLVGRNHLPESYRKIARRLRLILAADDQALRFRQVRNYIQKNVYAQLD
jgi:hypothetical protein